MVFPPLHLSPKINENPDGWRVTMEQLLILNGVTVVVADGRKALFLRNAGDATYPNFETVELMENSDPRATHEAGTDRPGRVHQSADARRGAIEETDFHDLEEKRFARDVASVIASGVESGIITKVVLVAPPRTLAVLRKELPAKVHGAIIGEVNKDFTNRPVHEIERALTKH
jgi:protein required for attachment to host cells